MASPARRFVFAIVAPVQHFFRLEAAGGIVLIVAALLAFGVASSPLAGTYQAIVQLPVSIAVGAHGATMTLHELVNDLLMTVFFAVAGMEIKRELVMGELNGVRRAALPLIAAAGGMLVPALIYLAINGGAATRHGWAIPTATDIAFALGCLSIVKKRVPWSLFVFLTALAIFDDLGAILVIALAYGTPTTLVQLLWPLGLTAVLIVVGRARVQHPAPYVLVGALLWYAVARAGLHPTLAGVIVGLCIPTVGKRTVAGTLDDLEVAIETLRQLPAQKAEGALVAIERHVRAMQPPVERLVHLLHGPVAFGIVPLFALVNAGVALHGTTLTPSVAWGVGAALVLGKFGGVLGATFATVRLGIAPLPRGARWPQIAGVALVAGIGFTMSLFVTELAFPHDLATAMSAKVGILGGSVVSSILGLTVLRILGRPEVEEERAIDVFHVDLPRFGAGYRVASWTTNTALGGKSLADAALRREHGVTVLGVYPEQVEADEIGPDGVRIRKLRAVGPDYILTAGETLLVVGERVDVDRFLAHPDAT